MILVSLELLENHYVSNIRICNHCAGKIVTSLNEFVIEKGLIFCCTECAESYYSPENCEPYPIDIGGSD